MATGCRLALGELAPARHTAAMAWSADREALRGRVAVVAGATRGAGRGIAAALGEAGATVICTGRSTPQRSRSDYDRPETIEETAELVTQLGGTGIAGRRRPSRLRPGERLAERIRDEHGHIDVLVNDIWGGELLKGGPARVEYARSGSSISTRACGSCGSPSTRTSSRRTTCCRCWSTGPAGCWSR